jgi:pilus assembly protein Flp/PilA
MRKLANLVADDSGQDLIEYAMLAALVGLASVVGLQGVASHINNTFVAVETAMRSNCPQSMSCMTGRP